MAVTLEMDLPKEIATRFPPDSAELQQYAREAVAVQMYRDGYLTQVALGRVLGLSRVETESLLGRLRVEEGCLSLEEVLEDVRGLQQFLGMKS